MNAQNAPASLGVVDQVVVALDARNRLAAMLGALLGAVVPVGTYWVAHHELDPRTLWQPAAGLVLGGLVFSAKTVLQWGALAFQDRLKATGFVLLVEGTMVFSKTPWLALVMLAVLVAINGTATGCTLALSRTGKQAATRHRTSRATKPRLRAVAGGAT